MNREELEKKLNEAVEDKDILYFRGKLISTIKKEISEEKDYRKKEILELSLYDELKKHKDQLNKMLSNKSNKQTIPDRVALKVKEIATTMEIFMRKKDVLGLIKNTAISSLSSSLVIGAITAAIAAVGGTLSLATLASLVPTISYISLSNLLSNILNGTGKSKSYDKHDTFKEDSEKERKFCEEYIANNKEFIITLLNENKADIYTLDEKIINEKKLISLYKNIIDNAPNEDVKQVITLEMIDVMKKLQLNYEEKESKFLHNSITLSNEEVDEFEKEKNKLSLELFKKENFIKETGIESLKKFGKNTAIIYASKLILSTIFPNFAFKTVSDLTTPLAYSLINNVVNSGNISKMIKLKKTNYTESVIKFTHPELFEEEKKKNMQVKLA